VWDYTKPYDSSDMTEDYSDRGENMPFKVAMHPSGWTLACATKECILAEYAVTLSGLTLVRQVVNAKTPFISSDGTSYGNSAPISIVKYAYGGHLLAVVCGKLIQLFHMYHLDYSFSELSTEKQGKPKRVMTIAGHSTSINDVVFSSDDTTIFSCSLDGTVFR
jgi:WD40 repeat protein